MSAGCPFELSLTQKRQATLIYHFTSLDYLQGLLLRIDGLLQYADYLLERRKVVEPFMYSAQWGARHTGANWSSTAYPAIVDFREQVLKAIASRDTEVYGDSGAAFCSRMLAEYSMMWMSPDQEEAFKQRFEEVSNYAGEMDGIVGLLGRATPWGDYSFWVTWQQHKGLFPRLPKFRVHTDIVGRSGEVPPRTGAYVPADDPHGAMQFAWIGTTSDGYRQGKLLNCKTFNDIGLDALAAVGREGLWSDDVGLAAFFAKVWHRIPDAADKYNGWLLEENGAIKIKPRLAAPAVSRSSSIARACDWYFVELLEGEFEDGDATELAGSGQNVPPPQRARHVCTATGWWSSPAKHDSRRHFLRGDLFPDIPSDTTVGYVQWQWDDNQQDSNLPPELPREANSLQPAPRAGLWLQANQPEVRCRVAEGEPLPLVDGLSVHWQWAEQPPPGMRATSGQPCPYPGIWYCEDLPTGPHAFLHGVPLPQVQGRDVTWFLVRTQ